MNNISFNVLQFNDVLARKAFFSILERFTKPKKVNYPIATKVDYQKSKKVNYPTAKGIDYQKPKKVNYPIANKLI